MSIINDMQNNFYDLVIKSIGKYNIYGIIYVIGLMIICISLTSVIQLILHEFGHYLFGKLTKHKFICFNVFNLVIYKENDQLKIKKCGYFQFTGQCLMKAPNENTWALCTIGGALLNISTVLLAAVMIFYNQIYTIPIICLFVTGLIYSVSNIIPLYNELNDGAVYMLLKYNKQAKEARFKQLAIAELLYQNKEYKEIPEELFLLSNDTPNNDISSTLLLLRYYRCLDNGNIQEAKSIITKLIFVTHMSDSIIAKEIALEKIYCDIINDRNPHTHKKALKCLMTKTNNINLLRIQIAYNSDNEKSFTLLVYKYLTIKKKSLYKKEDKFNIKLIENLYTIEN